MSAAPSRVWSACGTGSWTGCWPSAWCRRGAGYRIIQGLVARSPLDELGNPEGKADFPDSLKPEALRLAGLVSDAEYAEACVG